MAIGSVRSTSSCWSACVAVSRRLHKANSAGQFFMRLPARIRRSQRPAAVMTEAMFPNAERLEMFAGSRRDGWDSFGNEVI
jgi:N6-adenosine-specific RNA methylase IME4